MCLYKELFISFDISLKQIPKSEIYGARNVFMAFNIVLPNYLQGILQLTTIKIINISIIPESFLGPLGLSAPPCLSVGNY